MNSSNLYYPISGLINAFTSIILGIFVLSRNKTNIKHITYALFCSSIAIWSSFYFAWLITDNAILALFYSRAFMAGAIFIPVFYLHHICSLLNQTEKRKKIIILAYLFGILSLIFDVSPYYITTVKPRLSFKFWPSATPLFSIFLTMWALIVVYGAYLIWTAYKNAYGLEKNRLRYVLIATVVGWGGGATNYPLWYGMPMPPFLNILVSAYIVIVGYAIVRHHLMDIEVLIKKTLIFASLFTIVFGIFVGITVLMQQLVVGGGLLGLAISSVIIIFTVRPVENFLIRITDKYLFQKKYDYKHLIRQFMEELKTMVLNAHDIAQSTLDFLNSSIHPVSSALFMYNKFTNKYDIIASADFKDNEFKLSDDTSVVNELKDKSKIVDINRDKLLSKHDKDELSQLGIELTIPLIIHKDLLGILCLGRKKSDEQYTEEDIEALSDLSSALSIAINNAQLFDERADAEKRAMIGTLATGINHEIGNPLNIISIRLQSFRILAKQGILEKKTKEDIIKEIDTIAEVCLNSAQRIAEITKKVSEFAKPDKKLVLDKTNVSEAIDETISVLEHELVLEKIQFEKDIVCDPPYVIADRGQIKQILFNLVKNAAQAINKENGKIIVRVDKHGRDEIVMKVIDNGSGIPAKDIDKVFMPFYTTKEPGKGTGLGLALVNRLVERNSGRIEVESQEGKGTIFTIVFKGNCYE